MIPPSRALALSLAATACATVGAPSSPRALPSSLVAAQSDLQRCYEDELPRQPELEGQLVFAVEVGPTREVSRAFVLEDRLGSAAVVTCALAKLEGLRVPEAEPGAVVHLPLTVAPTRTLAILPFDNLSKDPADDWLRNGLPEVLLAKLGSLPRIVLVDRMKLDAVIAEQALAQTGVIDERSASATGELLGAQLLVTGSCQRVGSSMRFTARILDVRRGTVRQAIEATGEADDLFALEGQLAMRLAESLHVLASPAAVEAMSRRVAQSAAVLELLGKAGNALQGVGGPRELGKAAVLFRQVIDIDPGIPEAYMGLARALWSQREREGAAIREALAKAVEVRPHYYEALSLLGFLLWSDGKIDEGLAMQKRALALKPSYAQGHYGVAMSYAAQGKAEDALVLLAHALELDPDDSEYETHYGLLLATFKRDFAGALAHVRRGAEHADAVEWSFAALGYVQLMAGDAAGCLRSVELGKARRRPDDPPRHGRLTTLVELGCRVQLGQIDKARELLAALGMSPAAVVRQVRQVDPSLPAFVRVLFADLADKVAPLGQ